MKLIFEDAAWEDYVYWLNTDRRVIKKINELISDIRRTPHAGLGKPEPLRFELTGWWSRRIDLEHRLVYRVEGDSIQIAQCRYHYRRIDDARYENFAHSSGKSKSTVAYSN